MRVRYTAPQHDSGAMELRFDQAGEEIVKLTLKGGSGWDAQVNRLVLVHASHDQLVVLAAALDRDAVLGLFNPEDLRLAE